MIPLPRCRCHRVCLYDDDNDDDDDVCVFASDWNNAFTLGSRFQGNVTRSIRHINQQRNVNFWKLPLDLIQLIDDEGH